MTLKSFRDSSKFLEGLISKGYLDKVLFNYVDIGVSGGIPYFWNQFKPYIKAIGFDPLVNEIERLKREELYKNYEYEDSFIVANKVQFDAEDGVLQNPLLSSKSMFSIPLP